MKIIALEEHFMTPEVYAANMAVPEPWRDLQIQQLEQSGLLRQLEDVGEGRLKRMDDQGVDVQVISLSTPGTQSLDPELSVRLARQANDALAQAVKAHPDRFQGFATLPTPDPQAAADELRRAVQTLGFKGALLSGHTRGVPADDRRFWPIYQAAEELRAPLYLHPQIPVKTVRDAYYQGFNPQVEQLFSGPGWGWHMETGIQTLRMMLSGVFDTYPGLQLILGHWGEMLTFYTGRIDSILSQPSGLQRPVRDVMRQNVSVTPSGIFEQASLRYAVEVLGLDRILFAVDDPFVPLPQGTSRQFLQGAQLSEADREKIASGNWERLTGHLG